MLVLSLLLLLVATSFADEVSIESTGCSCNVNNTVVNPYLQNTSTTIVTELDDVGIIFYPTTGPPPVGGGAPGPVARGFIFIPDACVKPKAYAPFLTHINVDGHVAVVVNTNGGEARTLARVLKVLEIYGNALTYWAIGGHGEGGTWASRVARALHPKVKGLILVASLPDPAVDFTKLNIVVNVIYGTQDSVVTTSQVLAAKATLPPSAYFQAITGASHSDFAFVHGSCVDPADTAFPSQNETYSILVGPTVPAPINSPSSLRVAMTILQIYETMPEALAYAGNTSYSTYVQTPTYFAFVPTQNVPRVGYIYHVGAAVAPEAYFPALRQIADKGFLVVALRLPNHYGLLALNASGPVIDSFPSIPHWVIGGHSLGAVSASWDASILTPKVKGLILHDSGPRHNISSTPLRVLYAYGAAVGTGDRIPAGSLATVYFSRLPPYTIYYPIEGGNHYQFGWYGTQNPPAIASISRQVQTTSIVESAFQFLVQFSRLP